jgi:hypothetical protein
MSKKDAKKKGSPKPSSQAGVPAQKPPIKPAALPKKSSRKEQPQPDGQPGFPPLAAGKKVSPQAGSPPSGLQSQKKLSERQLILQSHRDGSLSRRRTLITVGVAAALLGVLAVTLLFGSRQPALTAILKEEGLFDCFPAGLQDSTGAPVYCQTSPVLYDGTNIYFASSQPIPGEGYSSLFSMPFSDSKPATDTITYLTGEKFLQAQNYESMAISSDGEYVFAMTGFDRVNSESAELNGYNMLLAWPTADPSKVQVVSATTTTEGVTSSVSMRNKFIQLLNNVTYFKISGMTAIPGKYLLFGVSEMGESAENFEPVFKIITVPYTISADTGEITLSDKFLVKYTFDPAAAHPEIQHKLSLSSVEYDPYQNRLLILTSYNEGNSVETVGGYLWMLTIDDLNNARLPQLVTNPDGTPFEFAYKPDGLTVIDKNVYLVANNIGTLPGREPQQTTYQIIELSR